MPENTAEKLEQDLKRGEQWLIWIGIAALFMNALIAFIYWGQLREMRRTTDAAAQASQTAKDTLSEMRNGSGATDTHTLAEQAVTQAKQTTALVFAANKQAAQTEILARQAAAQAAAAESEATASAESVKIASQQLDSSQRPWIRVDISIAAFNSQVPRPISFDNQGNLGVSLVISGHNIGKSPALNVSIEARLIPSPPFFAKPAERSSIEAQQKLLCSARYDMLGSGDTVFPEGVYPLFRHVSLSADAVRAEIANPTNHSFVMGVNGVTIDGMDSQDQTTFSEYLSKSGHGRSNPSLSVIGCLRYFADYSPTERDTLFMYDLNGIDLRAPNAQGVTITQHFSWGNTAK